MTEIWQKLVLLQIKCSVFEKISNLHITKQNEKYPYIYLYLVQNRLLVKNAAIKRVEVLVEKYIILDSLLSKLTTIPGKETVLLAIPEICANKILLCII